MLSPGANARIGLCAATLMGIGCISLLISGTLHRGDLRAGLPGSIAPDFALRDADNKPVDLSDLRGNFVIVYFRGNSAACPTSGPSDSNSGVVASAEDSNQPADSHGVVASAVSKETENLSELSAICHDGHNPHLRVLKMETPTVAPDADSAVAAAASASASVTDSAVQTVIDPTGDVARKFKIDKADGNPTFFVIDPKGVIRYRGNTAPATQPSGSAQLGQMLLSSDTLGLVLPGTNHF